MATDEAWGLSSTGFFRPQADEIRAERVTSWLAKFGADRNTKSDTVDGHFIDFHSEMYSKVFEGLEACYQATFIGTASGVQLRELGKPVVGAVKASAPSTVSWVLWGDDATVVPAGTAAVHSVTNEPFTNDVEVTLGAGDVTFAVGVSLPAIGTLMRITINGTDADYTTIAPDTVASIVGNLIVAILATGEPVTPDAAGPLITLDESTGSAMTVTAFDDDTGDKLIVFDAVRAAATATNDGPTQVSTGSSWILSNPVTGLNNPDNPDPGITGQSDETDPEYKTRIRNSTLEGRIAAELLELDGVTFTRVYENDTDVIDVEGRPPHSIEAVVLGGTPTEIAQVLFDETQGIQTFGSASAIAVDGNGDDQTQNWNTPTEIPIFVDATVTQGEDWPTTGAPLTDVKTAIEVYLDSLTVGQDVTPAGIFEAAKAAVSEVADLVLLIDDDPTPVASGVFSIGIRELATLGGVVVA